MSQHKTSLAVRILDAAEAPFVGIVLVVCRPSYLLRFISEGWRLGFRISMLNRVGLLSSYMRAQLDRTLGHEDRCLAALEGIVAAVEESAELPLSRPIKVVLHDMYLELVRLYLHGGQLEDGAGALIRGCKFLGVERLHGLSSFDFKSAQIVKAAVAAGRMLADGATATFMVKAGVRGEVEREVERKPSAKRPTLSAVRTPVPVAVPTDPRIAKIIPFPEQPRK